MIKFCKQFYPAMYSCFVHSGLVSIATSPTVLFPSLVVAPLLRTLKLQGVFSHQSFLALEAQLLKNNRCPTHLRYEYISPGKFAILAYSGVLRIYLLWTRRVKANTNISRWCLHARLFFTLEHTNTCIT